MFRAQSFCSVDVCGVNLENDLSGQKRHLFYPIYLVFILNCPIFTVYLPLTKTVNMNKLIFKGVSPMSLLIGQEWVAGCHAPLALTYKDAWLVLSNFSHNL